MPYGGMRKNRYGASVEGWSAVDKVAQFSQAVGRVSSGRGSAILIALMNSKGQLIDTSSLERSENAGGGGANVSRSFTHPGRAGISGPATMRAPQHDGGGGGAAGRVSGNGAHDAAEPGGPAAGGPNGATSQNPPALGVLLTTSHVFRSPKDMASASVCFLDQPIIGMAALLGREPRPVRVGLCSAFGFVSSVAPPKVEREEDTHQISAAVPAAPHHARVEDVPDYLLYAAAAAESDDDDEAEEIGFTLTYCDVFPAEDYAAGSAEPSPAVSHRRRSAGSHGSSAESAGLSPCTTSSSGGAVSAGETQGNATATVSPALFSDLAASRLPRSGGGGGGGGGGAPSEASPPSSGWRWNRAASERVKGGGHDSLLQVQPLPVPLLLSTIPAIKVGDIHLMITHVNDGRRSYRVQHVAAVFADHCTYVPTGFGGVTCSGGPVFNTQGDFIGVQHERNGQSLCLSIKSIVRHLFDSDLLGMCRSPISEETVKEREVHARPGDAIFTAMTAPRQPGPTATSPTTTDGASASPRRDRVRGDPLPALLPHTLGPASPSMGGGVSIDAPSPSDGSPLVGASCVGSPRTRRQRTSVSTAGSSRKGDRLTAAGSPAAPLVAPQAKPLSQCVPSFEEVFAEFCDGADSLPHILYAFPHSLPLVKLTMESLAQLKYEDELEHMAASGGVGAILETIDGYPQEEQIVAGALAALCRVCLYERNLAMFLHLDGVVTVMEIMKEYVHQQTVLQWGTYTLLFATDPSCASAAASIDLMVRSSAPQLLVNVLRVHGGAQRKSAARRAQHNRLVRWMCDLIANLLMANPRVTTLFLREDLLTLLLQFSRDYAGNMFLMEGIAHVFCAFVQCFAETETPPPSYVMHATSVTGGTKGCLAFSQAPGSATTSLLREPGRSSTGGVSSSLPFLPGALPRYSPHAVGADPHKVSFFFLCDAMRHDTDGGLARAVLDVCEAALDPKNSLTAHRGRPGVVLQRCLETFRLLLTWRLVRLPRGVVVPSPVDAHSSLGPSGELMLSPSLFSSPSTPPLASLFVEDRARLLAVCDGVRQELTSSSALVAKAEAVQGLLLQDG
ncbi:hypothetical protein NESM_000180500 [Novymonas esmeraldas]|uniref:Uncharacterized protein n=1 Tax=Novymonas esmeraldas TaxID=1808958 RepID=A0AAW0F3Q9_9TRYP